MKKKFTSKNITLQKRRNLVKAYVWSIALYGIETWIIRHAERRRLEAFQVWCRRRVMGVSWVGRVASDEVFRKMGEKRSLGRIWLREEMN
jgi:hypothetical protein